MSTEQAEEIARLKARIEQLEAQLNEVRKIVGRGVGRASPGRWTWQPDLPTGGRTR
jgi:hypothetical protein